MINELILLYNRDLDKLKKEIEAFKQESNLWKTSGSTANPAGNLCLHLMGNLKTYVGRNIGNYSYVRDRESEFTSKDISQQKLLNDIEETKTIVLATLQGLNEEKLQEVHPENALGYEMSNRFFLIHLAAHLSYHLGQINYLRRMLE